MLVYKCRKPTLSPLRCEDMKSADAKCYGQYLRLLLTLILCVTTIVLSSLAWTLMDHTCSSLLAKRGAESSDIDALLKTMPRTSGPSEMADLHRTDDRNICVNCRWTSRIHECLPRLTARTQI